MITQKCFTRNNIINHLCGVKWGSHPSTLLILYKSFIRSIIDFGSFLYYPTTKKLQYDLEKIQFNSLRPSMGYRNTTPTNVILAESKLQTIFERTKCLGKCYLTKVLSNTNHPVYSSLHEFLNVNKAKNPQSLRLIASCIKDVKKLNIKSQKKYNIYCQEYSTIITSIPSDIEFGDVLKKSNDPTAVLTKKADSDQAHIIYTDGSKGETDSVGIGVIYPKSRNKKIGLAVPNPCSIFSAECIAIYKALLQVKNSTHSNYIIATDSLSALLSLKSVKANIKDNFYIFEIKKIYNEILNRIPTKSVTLLWVPSHIGIEGNEAADALAKSYLHKKPNSAVKIPFTDFYEQYKKDSHINTIDKCIEEKYDKGTKYFELFHKNTSKPWFHKYEVSRNIIATINRCRANHYNLNASLHQVKIVRSPMCAHCGDYEDLNHTVWQCTIFDEKRLNLIKFLYKNKCYLPSNCDYLLTSPKSNVMKKIVTFLEDCDKFV